MEQSMTTKPDELLPSAKQVMQKIALAEAEDAEKQARMLAATQAEKKALIDELSKPSGISEEEAIRRGIAIIDRAAKNRATEVEVLRFPNQLCTDKLNGDDLRPDPPHRGRRRDHIPARLQDGP
jgi:hypothetical protein